MSRSEAPADWGACYYDHFSRFLRAPAEREVFRRDEATASIQILGFDGVLDQCRVFASLGLSHFERELAVVAEVLMPVDAAWDEVPALLANSLFHLVNERITLGWGLSIAGLSNISPSFARHFQKSAIYFTNPFGLPEALARVDCAGRAGSVFLATLISQAEHEFFKDKGAVALEEMLEARGVDPYNIARPSCL